VRASAARLGGGSRFKLNPDPPAAGQAVEVTYIGPATQVEYQVDGQNPVPATPDENGKFVIDPCPSGMDLYLSDNLGLPGYLHSNIVELDGGIDGRK
jgi:hypothetical protein